MTRPRRWSLAAPLGSARLHVSLVLPWGTARHHGVLLDRLMLVVRAGFVNRLPGGGPAERRFRLMLDTGATVFVGVQGRIEGGCSPGAMARGQTQLHKKTRALLSSRTQNSPSSSSPPLGRRGPTAAATTLLVLR
jgi:hypothetical protein